MAKFLGISSILGLLLLLLGCMFNPSNPAFWLATASPTFSFIRLGLILLISFVLLFGLPANKGVRFIVAILAAGFISWSALHTYSETLPFLDGMSFMAAGFAMLVHAFEPVDASYTTLEWNLLNDTAQAGILQFKRKVLPYALASIIIISLLTQGGQVRDPARLMT